MINTTFINCLGINKAHGIIKYVNIVVDDC